MREKRVFGLIWLAVMMGACASDDDSDDTGALDAETAAVLGVFENHCAISGCHSATSASANLDLSIDDPASALSNVDSSTCTDWERVVPGMPAESLLFEKLGNDPPCGSRMPLAPNPANVEPFSDSDRMAIEAWIISLGTP